MKRISLVVLTGAFLAALFYSVSAALAPKPDSAAYRGKRFLFISDVSDSMTRLEHDGRQALFDMIYTGLDGYMREGDTFGLWTFKDTVAAGLYPMQVWRTNDLLQLASRASFYVKDAEYKKRSNMKNAVAAADSVMRVIKDLDIIIISDENAHMEGTLFDEEINRRYDELSEAVRKKKQPILTILTVADGKIEHAKVLMPGEPMDLPYRPEPPPPAPKETTVARKESPPPAPSPKFSSARSIVISGNGKDPVTGENQVVVQVDSGNQITVSTQANGFTIEGPSQDAPIKAPAVTAPAPQQAVAPEEPSPSQSAEPTPAEAPADRVKPSVSSKSDPTPMERALAMVKQGATPVAAREPSTTPDLEEDNTNRAVAGLTVLSSGGSSEVGEPWRWWLGGAGCLICAIGLLILFLRLHRRTQEPSVITQSLYRR